MTRSSDYSMCIRCGMNESMNRYGICTICQIHHCDTCTRAFNTFKAKETKCAECRKPKPKVDDSDGMIEVMCTVIGGSSE